MSKPGARRSEFADRLERRRRPSMAAMDRAAEQLELERAAAEEEGRRFVSHSTTPTDAADAAADRAAERAAEEADKPEIALPAEEGHPHGQLTVAYNPATGITWGFNFVEHPWRDEESIREMADRVDEFAQHGTVAGEPATRLEFRSPHDGRLHCLTREGARRVLAVDHARTLGQVAPHSDEVHLVRVRPELLVPRGGRRSA